MPPKTETISNGGARFTHRVLAVFPKQSNRSDEREDIGQSSIGLIHQFVTLDASFDPAASILFRFSLIVSKSIILYYQILPDRIASFERIPHDNAHLNPELDTIHRELDGVRRLICLRFRLHKTGHLITPVGFQVDHSDTEALHNFNAIKSLAANLDFSVYMRPDVLTKSKFAIFQKAIKQPRDAAHVSALEWRADPSRLYNGKGGIVVTQCEESVSSPASCASTVAVDSPPGYRAQSSSIVSAAPPAYQQARHDRAPPVEVLGKRLRSNSSNSKSPELRPTKRGGQQSSAPDLSSIISRDDFQALLLREISAVVRAECQKLIIPFQSELEKQCQKLSEHYHRKLDKLESSFRPLEHQLKELEGGVRTIETITTNTRQLQAEGKESLQIMKMNIEKLQGEVIQQQEDSQTLRDKVKELQEEEDQQSGLLCELQEHQDEFERRQEEYEDNQAILEKRQDSAEEAAELTDVRILGLEDFFGEDWRNELLDQVRDQSAAAVREFLRSI